MGSRHSAAKTWYVHDGGLLFSRISSNIRICASSRFLFSILLLETTAWTSAPWPAWLEFAWPGTEVETERKGYLNSNLYH
jgi:hypothetical protein